MILSKNVALVGFMGTGKSTIGRLVARELGWRFADTDQLIERRAGCEISEIFAREGERFFRAQEHAALASLRGEWRHVVATGGGIVTRGENVSLLRELGFVVWLTADEETIFERVSRNANRPLLHTPHPRATVAALLAARRPLYESAAHFALDTAQVSQAEAAKTIVAETLRFFS